MGYTKLLDSENQIETALRRVGELLVAEGVSYRILIIGGAAMVLGHHVNRATTDVDILAFGEMDDDGATRLFEPNDPLPPELIEARVTVARDLNLDPQWLNSGPASQWRTGLPPGLQSRVTWRESTGLTWGIAARIDLIYFKLYAAADDGPRSVHMQDLLALNPTSTELEAAEHWVREQDPSSSFAALLEKTVAHALEQLRLR